MILRKYFAFFLLSIFPFALFAQRKTKKKDKFDFKLGLNYAINNFSEIRVNGSTIFPNFEKKNRIGFTIKPEYNLTKFLSLSIGMEVLAYKISFDGNVIANSPFLLHNHKLKILESHIPFEINYRQKIKKGNYLYFGAGVASRFILRSRGQVENLSTSIVHKSKIDFRFHYVMRYNIINFKDFRFNLGYERKLNEKFTSFVEVGYRNIPLYYFYGGGEIWLNDILMENNSFINFTIGLKI